MGESRGKEASYRSCNGVNQMLEDKKGESEYSLSRSGYVGFFFKKYGSMQSNWNQISGLITISATYIEARNVRFLSSIT